MNGSRRARWIIVVAAVLGVVIALVVLLAPDPAEQAVAGGTTTTTTPAGSSTSLPTTTVTTTAPATTSSFAPTAALTPGRLAVTTAALEFGSSGVLRQLQLRNAGEQSVLWSAKETAEWLTLSPGSGAIAGGRELRVAVSLDRSLAPEGPLSTAIAVTGPDGVVSVPVTGSADHSPTITGEETDAVLVFATPCDPHTTKVSTTVADGIGVASVSLGWRTPDAREHTAAMTSTGGVWQEALGPFDASGDITWWVVATDTGGNDTRTQDHVLPVVPCLSR